MEIRISEIASEFDAIIQSRQGGDTRITGINSIEDCGPGDLIFVEDKKLAQAARRSQPSGIVITESLLSLFPPSEELGILICSNVRLAHALIKQRYADREFPVDEWDRLHPSAVIHPTARISESCFVGPNVVVGKNAVVGERCRLLAGAVIEHGASLGDHCIIHPRVLIGHHCRLASEVEIGAGSVIGSEGYGFAQDEAGKSHRIPQTGSVVIEDRVRIGAQTCIDRAAYGITRIGAGTKIDNLCHIAHSVDVGEDCLLTAMLCVAGSTKIGDRVMTSGQTGILGHLNIGDDVILVHRAGVTRDIQEPGMYGGLPLQPIDELMKTRAHLKKLNTLAGRVKDLERQLQALQPKSD